MGTEELLEMIQKKEKAETLVPFEKVSNEVYLEAHKDAPIKTIPNDNKKECREHFKEITNLLQIDENDLKRNYHGRMGYFFNHKDVPFVKMILQEYTQKLKPLRYDMAKEVDPIISMQLIEGYYSLLLHSGKFSEDEVQNKLQDSLKLLGYPYKMTDYFQQSLKNIVEQAINKVDYKKILSDDAQHYYRELHRCLKIFLFFSRQLLWEIEDVRNAEIDELLDDIPKTTEKIQNIILRYISIQQDALEKNKEAQKKLPEPDWSNIEEKWKEALLYDSDSTKKKKPKEKKHIKLKDVKKIKESEEATFQLIQEIYSKVTMPLSQDDLETLDTYCKENQICLELSGSQMTYQDFQILENHFYDRKRKPSGEVLAEAEKDLLTNTLKELMQKNNSD